MMDLSTRAEQTVKVLESSKTGAISEIREAVDQLSLLVERTKAALPRLVSKSHEDRFQFFGPLTSSSGALLAELIDRSKNGAEEEQADIAALGSQLQMVTATLAELAGVKKV